jgi:surface antigen
MARLGALTGILLAAGLVSGCTSAGSGPANSVSAFSATETVPGTVPSTPTTGALAIKLDPRARKAAKEAEHRALEFGRAGTPVGWRTGRVYGDVVPGTLYQVNASTCRDFTHTIYSGGTSQKNRGTACRAANGTWQPVT